MSDLAVRMLRLFTAREVKQLVGISQRQLAYWDGSRLVQPHGSRAQGPGTRRLYTLLDVVQLKIICRLMDAGFSLQKIRVALAFAKELQEEPAPLRELEIVSDGQRILIVHSDDRLVDALSGQFLLRFAVADLVAEVECGTSIRPIAQVSSTGGSQ